MMNWISLLASAAAAITLSMPAPVQQQTVLPAPDQIQSQIDALAAQAWQQAVSLKSLKAQMQEYIASHADSRETWNVAVCLPDSDLSVSFGQEPQTAASTIKLFVVGTVMENYDSIDIDKEVLDHLIASSLIISDNDAATELVILLGNGDIAKGKERVNNFCKDHGYMDTFLGIIFAGYDDTGTYNATTSADTVAFLSDLLDGRIAGSEQILEYMSQSDRTEKIPDVLPEEVKTANKTGELDQTENDACIVYGPDQTYILAVMADETRNPDKAVQIIQELSKMTYTELEGK